MQGGYRCSGRPDRAGTTAPCRRQSAQLYLRLPVVARFPEILEHDFSDGSRYNFIEEQYDVRLARNEAVVRIENADSRSPDTFIWIWAGSCWAWIPPSSTDLVRWRHSAWLFNRLRIPK
ncbi:hypothetical protein DKK75_07090 [Bifidobacterium asteroides]|uniref:Uncharacterized protein n=1 Tax=Bifidobacterium asteroides TaxID=1684 RepID=A0A318M3Q1_9BIFI|nr:hypothetical protein DKK75_07090 [Bifidobacterium asteroides]